MMNHSEHEHSHSDDLHGHSLSGEIICHFPQAVFAVTVSLSVAAFVTFFSGGLMRSVASCAGAHMLFHVFHFMHILFAATGTVVTFRRFSDNLARTLLVGTICPIIFCALSDIIIPYIGGRLLGVAMEFHVCFYSELVNVIPFLLIGLINGFAISRHPQSRKSYAHFSHVSHVFISSLAATFYLISHGFATWYMQIGMVFVFLVIAIMIPCTLSDIVVPITVAKAGNKDEKH